MKDAIEILERKGVKPTVNRVLVMNELSKISHPISLADLEISLSTMDKASIFRVLKLFSEKDIIHVIEDGSRSLKYELCPSESHHHLTDQHVHFYCENCKETFCLENEHIPMIKIPKGFRLHSVNYMLKGLCPKCNKGV
ncbi:MAG: Fur family transcriptional regulator [Candidatus Egerieousia sp.]